MEENLKKLQKDIKKLDSYRVITTDELSQFLNDVANVLAQYRSATSTINKETKDTLNLMVKRVQEEHDRILGDVDEVKDSSKKEFDAVMDEARKLLAEIKSIKVSDGYTPIHGIDYFDGESPMYVGVIPPPNPKKGDIWYKN